MHSHSLTSHKLRSRPRLSNVNYTVIILQDARSCFGRRSIQLEVPTDTATLHEDQHHGSHKADLDFRALLWDSEALVRVINEFRPWNKLSGGAIVEKSWSAMKRGSPQIRRKIR